MATKHKRESYIDRRMLRQVKEELENGRRLICFDTETTGVNVDTDRIVQLSMMEFSYHEGLFRAVGKTDIFLNPERPIPEAASAVNHITNEMVSKAPTEREAIKKIAACFGEHPILCGYNSVSFDQSILEYTFERNGLKFEPQCNIDVYVMAREKLRLKSYKLENVATEIGANHGVSFHNSMGDVMATMRVLKTLLPYYENEEKLDVSRCGYWKGQNHRLERVYVSTYPSIGNDAKIYYDCAMNMWTSVNAGNLDFQYISESARRYCRVSTEKEMVDRLKNLNTAFRTA